MEKIDHNDWLNDVVAESEIEDEEEERPLTATKQFSADDVSGITSHLERNKAPSFDEDVRPTTNAIIR